MWYVFTIKEVAGSLEKSYALVKKKFFERKNAASKREPHLLNLFL